MATIVGLTVEFKAKTKKLTKALKGAKARVGRFARAARKAISKAFSKGVKKAITSIKKLVKSIFSIKGALAAALSVGGLIVFFDRMTKNVKELSVWSKTLNVSINDLQKFGFAVKSVGFDMDKMTDILKDVQDKMGDFLVSGGGEAADIFEEMGQNIDDFKNLGPVQILEKLERVTSKLSDKKRIFIFEALANDASKLLPLLSKNSKELNRMAKEFESFGLRFTKQQVANANQFQKQMGVMGTLWSGFTQMLASELAPAFNPFFNMIKKAVKDMGGMREVTQTVARFAVTMGIAFLNAFDKAQKGARILAQEVLKAFTRISRSANTMIGLIIKGFDSIPGIDMSESIKQINKFDKQFTSTIDNANKRIKGITKEANVFAGVTSKLQLFRANIGGVVDFANSVTAVTDTTRALTKAEKKRAKALKKEQKREQKELEKKNGWLAKLKAQYEATKLAALQLAQVEQGGGLITQLQGAAKKASEAVNTKEGSRNRQILEAGLEFLKRGGPDGKGEGGIGGEIKILITTDEKGLIKPVVQSSELKEKVKVLINGVISKQAIINDR